MKRLNTRKKGQRGFTLIELIVVLAIIGIAASIAVPSFSNIIERMQIRNLVHSAQIAEDAAMALTGMQYADTETGNPPIVDWPGDPAAAGSQFVYIQKGQAYDYGSAGACFRLAPANLAASGTARTSEGLDEFYKRTLNDLPAVGWKTGYEQNLACSLYFLLSGSNIDAGVSAVDPGKFVRYDFAYSEYFLTENGKDYAVFHGIRFHAAGAKTGDAAAGAPVQDPGEWHVYEIDGGRMIYSGTL